MDKRMSIWWKLILLKGFAGGTPGTIQTVTGVSPLALVNSLAKPLQSLTRYGRCEQRNPNPPPTLPDGYTVLASASNADINNYDASVYTGYTATNLLGTKLTVFGLRFSGSTSDNKLRVAVDAESSGSKAYGILCNGNYLCVRVGGNTSYNLDYTLDANPHDVSLEISDTGSVSATVDGAAVSFLSQPPDVTTGINAEVQIFGSPVSWYAWEGSIGRVKLEQNGATVFDMWATQRDSDSRAGFYNTVTNAFVLQSGGTALTAGDPYPSTPTPKKPFDIWCNNGSLVARHESGLPTGVTLLDSVYNSANTRVDTGLSADVDDIEMEIRVKPSTNSWYIFQSRGSTMFGISGANSGSKIQATVGGLVLVSDIVRDTTHIYTVRFTARNGNATLYVKDETDNTEDTKTDTYTFPAGGYAEDICIWGNTSGNTVAANNYVYYAKMWKSGSLALDYVPATKGTDNGFYDRASNTFKTKTSSSGSINAGDPVSDPVGVYADGTPETLTVGGQTVNVADLFAVGAYADTEEIIEGIKTGKIGVKVFDGTEGWAGTSTNGLFRLPGGANGRLVSNGYAVLCTHFHGVPSDTTGANMQINDIRFGYSTGSNAYDVYIKTDMTAVSGLTGLLAEKHPIVLYPLAEPVTEQLTPQPVDSVAGTTTITSSAPVEARMRVEYWRGESVE